MKRIILFLPLLLLIYVNLQAENNDGRNSLALVADFTASITSGCGPLSVQFTSTSTSDAGDPIVSYSWNFGDGSPAGTGANPNHTFANPPVAFQYYTISLTIITQGGATKTATKTDFITVYRKPVFDFGPDYAVCEGSTPTITLVTESVGGYVYNWGPPKSAVTTYTCNFTPVAGVNTYWAKVTNGACVTTDTLRVTASPALTPKIGYKILSTCGNVQVQFFDSSYMCDPGNSITYTEWDIDANGYYESNPIHTFATGGSYSVYMYVEDDEGNSDDKTITITLPNPTPGPSPVNLGADKTICLGNSVQLDAGDEPGATYVWTPATGLSSTSVYNPTASPASTQTYSVTKTKCGVSVTGTVTVNVNPPLVANLGPDIEYCGAFTMLDAGVSGATSYHWGSTFNPAYYAGRTTQTVAAQGTGTYWVTVTKNGCTASDTIFVKAKDPVTASFLYTPTGSGTCGPFKVDVQDNSIECVGSVNNQVWDFGDGTVINGNNPWLSHTYSAPGTYTITLIVTTNGGVKDTVSHTISYTGSTFSVDLGNDTTICAGNSVTIDAGPGASYSWNTGATSRTISVSPASTTTYTVTVTNSSGCTASDSRTITVASSVPVNLGNDTTICAGNSVTIDAGPGASYLWNTGATSRTISVSPASTTTYTVTVTNGGGCTGSDSKTITVGPSVSVDLGNDTTICIGSGITINAGNPGATYLWSTGETTQSIIVGPIVSTPYSVTVTNSSGCSATDSKTINIGSTVIVDLGNDTTICAGNSVTIDAGPGASYSWNTGATSRTISVSPASNTTYTVTVTNATGCTGSDSKTVNIGTGLNVNLGNDTTICAGNSVTIDAGPGASYSWNTGATSRTISVSPASNTTYTVTVTNATGCSGSDSKTVTIGAALTVNLGPDTAICPGSFIKLDPGNFGPTAKYLWGSTFTAMGGYNGKKDSAIGTQFPGSYWVTVTKDGCVGRDTVLVTHKDSLTAEFTTILHGSGSCGPYTVDVTDESKECVGSVATRTWDFGDGTVVISTDESYSHNYSAAGNYTIRLIAVTSGGIRDTVEHIISFTGSSIAVNLGNDTTVCPGTTIILDAGNPGSTYAWNTGQTSQTISVNTSGTYSVEVNNGLCKVIGTIQVTVSGALNIQLGNDTTICPLNSVTLDAGYYPGATYLWSSNAGNQTSQTVTVSPDDPTNVYTVTVTRGTCTGTGNKTVYVSSALPVNLGSDTAICSGSNITLDAGYPGAVYLWNNGTAFQTNTVNGAGSYKVTVDYMGCTGEDSINIALIAAPAPVNLGNDINVCFGNSLLLDAGEYTGATYLWSTGETTRTIAVSSSNVYSVSVANGCGSPVTDAINVTMGNLPSPVITQSGLELVCTQADTYQWYKDGILIPGATNQRYKAKGYGVYSVVVTNTALACSGKSADYWFVPAGDYYLGDIRVKITPNPSSGQTRLVLSKLPAKPIKTVVYDRIGRRLITREISNVVSDINMTGYAKGLYFVECVLDNKRVILPLVTQ